jgi:hypothetical protein
MIEWILKDHILLQNAAPECDLALKLSRDDGYRAGRGSQIEKNGI